MERGNYNQKSDAEVFTSRSQQIQESIKKKEQREQQILNEMLGVSLEGSALKDPDEEKENQNQKST